MRRTRRSVPHIEAARIARNLVMYDNHLIKCGVGDVQNSLKVLRKDALQMLKMEAILDVLKSINYIECWKNY